MNKLFSKIATLSVGLAMAIGVGVAVGSRSAKVVKAIDTDEYDISTTALTSLSSGTKVIWGIEDQSLVAKNVVESNWLRMSETVSDWTIFEVEESSGSFYLKNGSNYIYSSAAKKIGYSESNKTAITLGEGGLVEASGIGVYVYNANNGNGGIRSYASVGSMASTYLFEVTEKGTVDPLESITVSGSMSKTSYTTAESWDANGLVATGHYESGASKTISVDWTFSPASPTVGVTSVIATATKGTISGNSEAQSVTVTNPPADPGTEGNPYTVAQARAAIDAGSGTSNVYATGIVSQIVTAYSTQHENVSFNISVDGTTGASQLQAFREKSTYSSTVKVGDTVVVYGSLTKYKSTYEFAQDCAITSLIPAPEPETVDSIQEIYSAPLGSPVDINGYFVGAVSDGIYLMDGEYGIFVYKGTAPTGATVNETKLHVSGTSTTFNNLYQIAEGSNITVNASAEVATPINYTLTGSESTADLSVASRRLLEKGVISKITRDGTDYTSSYEGEVPTVDTSKDIFLTINGIQVIYKKSDVTQAVFEVLFGYLLNGKKVNVESFTGFYQTNFQLRFSSVVEATEGYTAEKFASDLLTKTDAVCAGYDGKTDNKAALASIWLELQENVLSDEEIDRFNDNENDFSSARARYDYLVGKYGLTDFLQRNPAPIPGGAYTSLSIEGNTTIFIVVIIAAVSTLAFTMLLVFKKKKHN